MKSKEKQPQAQPQRAQAAQKTRFSIRVSRSAFFDLRLPKIHRNPGPAGPAGQGGAQNGKRETGNGKREIGYEYFWKERKTGNGKRETGNGKQEIQQKKTEKHMKTNEFQ